MRLAERKRNAVRARVDKTLGFTLIELLIVVAIIGILAAIAIPSFLQAQTRGKVSRCLADMRSLATAAEIYRVDCNHYPLYGRIVASGAVQYPATDNVNAMNDQTAFIGYCITTPVAYVTRFFEDPFFSQHRVSGGGTEEGNMLITRLEYLNMIQHLDNFHGARPAWAAALVPAWGHWRMVGAGPDSDRGRDIKLNMVYDPTNETVSDGDIVRCQKIAASQRNPNAP